MPAFRRKYGVALTGGYAIRIQMIVAGAVDFAGSGDWTPATGDVKVSKDGGAESNITTLPTYSNGWWQFTLSASEMQAKQINVRIVDSATKAVEDNAFIVETFGNSSAMYPFDEGGDAATRLNAMSLATVVGQVVSDGSNSSTSFEIDTTLGAKTNDYFGSATGGLVLAFIDGTTNEWQARRIVSFNTTTNFVTVDEAFSATPTAGDAFIVLGRIEA